MQSARVIKLARFVRHVPPAVSCAAVTSVFVLSRMLRVLLLQFWTEYMPDSNRLQALSTSPKAMLHFPLLSMASDWLTGVSQPARSGLVLNVKDVIRIRASTDEMQTTFVQWEGEVLYAHACANRQEYPLLMAMYRSIYKPGQRPLYAFNVLGMNAARAKELEDGSYDLLSRELQLYLDPATNKILHQWTNPFTNESVNGTSTVPIHSLSAMA